MVGHDNRELFQNCLLSLLALSDCFQHCYLNNSDHHRVVYATIHAWQWECMHWRACIRHKPPQGYVNCGLIMSNLCQWWFNSEPHCRMQALPLITWTGRFYPLIMPCPAQLPIFIVLVPHDKHASNCGFITYNISFKVCFHAIINYRLV